MDTPSLHALRQQLERCYSLNSNTQTRRSGSWRKRLQAAWRTFATFMTDKPQIRAVEDDLQSDYTRKIRFYPYLPPIEEGRDWLEKSYRNSVGS